MYAIDNSTAVAAMPAPSAAGTAGFFTGGNPASGLPATILTADWLNCFQSELLNVLSEGGVAPNKAVMTQLVEAIIAIGNARYMPNQSTFTQSNQTIYTPVPSATGAKTNITKLTFTAPYDGVVYANAHFNCSNNQPEQCQGILQIQGSSYQGSGLDTVWSDTTIFTMSGSGGMRIKKGDEISVLASYNLPSSTSSFANMGQTVSYLYVPSGF